MAFLVMIAIALLGGAIYLVIAMTTVPGVREERLGQLEDLPEDIGKWRVDEASPEAAAAAAEGLIREFRHFYHEPRGFGAGGRLVLQVRYRFQDSRKIARIEPERAVERRRVRN